MTDAVHAMALAIAARHGDVPIDVVGVSLGCEFVARAAAERPAAFRSIVLVSATGLDRSAPLEGPPGSTRGKGWLLAALGRAPWSGAVFRGLTRPGVIRWFLEKTWGSKDIDEGLLAYDVATTRQPGASRAPFFFVSGYLFSADIGRVYRALRAPVLLVHGTRGDFTDYRYAPVLAREAGWTVRAMPAGALPYFEDLAGFAAIHASWARERGLDPA